MKLKNKPLQRADLEKMADITQKDIDAAILTSHPSLKPFLSASSVKPKIKPDATV